jgi:hypothetical protein
LENKIFSVSSSNFEEIALDVFHFQYKNNPTYKNFVNLLGKPQPTTLLEIPFLPISFFKTHEIRTFQHQVENVFKSSGTGGSRSIHYVESIHMYQQSFETTYRSQLGNPENQVIIALLPNYVEQGESSLVYMVNDLIQKSNNHLSGFYLNEPSKIIDTYKKALQLNKQVIIFGVSYALLDLALLKPDLSEAIIIETGGMKGRRKELTKEELHKELKKGFNVDYISSEYGMSELLSQAYSDVNGIFSCPPWMKILIRDVNDALSYEDEGKTGGINVIDLANLYSCSFIATQDLGKSFGNKFQLVGRFDNSDIRGCNLLIE